MSEQYLVVVSGTLEGKKIPIRGQLTIGRNPDSGLQVDDPQVSRRHAVVEQTPAGTILRDLGSGNGTYVGQQRVLECRLAPGDVIRVGQMALRFESVQTRAPQPPRTPVRGSGVRFKTELEGTLQGASADNIRHTFFQAPDVAATTEELRRAQERLAAVYEANQIISSERDLKKLFRRVMEQIFSLIPAHNGVILLKDEKTGQLVNEYVKSNMEDAEVVISTTIIKRAMEKGEAVVTLDAADDSRFEAGMSIIAQNISSVMCTPLSHLGETLGVLYVDTRGTTHAFAESDLQLLVALSGPASIAIKNAQYVHMLERSYHDTLIVTANAIELRDHYTVGHTWRVTNFAVEIARQLGWDEERISQAEMGGVLHDVGKIAVPDAVLGKASALTDEEYAVMKIHPERGARMLEDVTLLKSVIPYCLCHHERYDGRGYPHGLKGDDIPIEGRLVAVADTFDAMTSNRPYRKGRPPQDAIKEIERSMGTQLDPECANALIQCYREGKVDRILQEYMKGEQSIACPFCSTFIKLPEGSKVDDAFECGVCHRRVRLREQNEAYFGELVAETAV
jgi:HD-GYP domain-containing protein (c-di-GMP phosphodiesterase class II)